MYVPLCVADGEGVDLIVGIHGTSRNAAFEYRDGFSDFAEYHRCAVLCPIFPINMLGDNDRSSYKYIKHEHYRYDLALLGIVQEAAGRYDQDWSEFGIFGFSGGGHFAHCVQQPRGGGDVAADRSDVGLDHREGDSMVRISLSLVSAVSGCRALRAGLRRVSAPYWRVRRAALTAINRRPPGAPGRPARFRRPGSRGWSSARCRD